MFLMNFIELQFYMYKSSFCMLEIRPAACCKGQFCIPNWPSSSFQAELLYPILAVLHLMIISSTKVFSWFSEDFSNCPGGSDGKASAYNAGYVGSIPGSERSPGEGNGNPLQYSCLENLHGWRSLAGYSPWGRKESDTTERLHFYQAELYLVYWFGFWSYKLRYSLLYCTFSSWVSLEAEKEQLQIPWWLRW